VVERRVRDGVETMKTMKVIYEIEPDEFTRAIWDFIVKKHGIKISDKKLNITTKIFQLENSLAKLEVIVEDA
jgi:hypothetical protein